MLDDKKFWAEESNWEPDLPGYVYLARAVIRVGQAKVEGWDGTESKVEYIPELRSKTPRELGSGEKVRVLQAIGKLTPRGTDREKGFSGLRPAAFALHSLEITQDEFQQATAYYKAQHERTWPPFQRFCQAKALIAEACRDGILQSATRDTKSGKLIPVPTESWAAKTGDLTQRFSFCVMRPKEPFGLASAGDGFEPIYIGEETLAGFLGNGVPVQPVMARLETIPLPPAPNSSKPIQVAIHDLVCRRFPDGMPASITDTSLTNQLQSTLNEIPIVQKQRSAIYDKLETANGHIVPKSSVKTYLQNARKSLKASDR